MTAPPGSAQALIDRLVQSTGAPDAVTAIRTKAGRAVDAFVAIFGEPNDMPLDLLALASFLGIGTSEEAPTHSPDAELTPDGQGGVEMRLNQDRPETRRRFSIGHEITHTFFPDHSSHVWPRADARYRDIDNPDDHLEMLCDTGAAELVFPRRWFHGHAARVDSAAGLVDLAGKYRASRQATVRRYAELHPGQVTAVFFTWKLKPTQIGNVGRKDQVNLFGFSPADELRHALRMRVEYAIPSPAFAAAGHFVPRDKSVGSDGPLFQAASTRQPSDGECYLDLGQSRGKYRVHAVPLWTPEDERGPGGESAIAAILRPIDIRRPTRKTSTPDGPSLF